MTTDVLQLEEIAESQASKHVSHNEALRQIEGMLVRVLSRANGGPPGSPANGATYIVDNATGDWSSASVDDIAHYYGGSWHFYTPPDGLRLTVVDEGAVVRKTASGWVVDPARPSLPARTISANYTVVTSDRGAVLLVDTSGGSVTISLTSAATLGADFPVAIVKKTNDSNTVTIDPSGSQTIGWSSTQALEDRGSGTLIVSDGAANWVPVGGGSGGAGLPLDDDEDLFANASDATKILRFALAGLTSGATRTATWPDKDGTVAMLSDITGGGIASDELGEDSGNTSGLTWAYNAGSIRAGDSITEVSAGDVSLTASATNYVEVDPATGTVSVNTSGFTAGRIPMRELVTDGSGITVNTDRRAWLHGRVVFYTGLTEELPCADQVVSRPEIKDYAETRDTPSSSSGALSIDLEAGNVAEATLTEDTSIDFTNPPAAGKAGSLTLILKQDGTGGWSVTWPGSVQWPGGSAPSLSTDPDAVDVLTFVTTDGGTTWYGFLAGAGMA